MSCMLDLQHIEKKQYAKLNDWNEKIETFFLLYLTLNVFIKTHKAAKIVKYDKLQWS